MPRQAVASPAGYCGRFEQKQVNRSFDDIVSYSIGLAHAHELIDRGCFLFQAHMETAHLFFLICPPNIFQMVYKYVYVRINFLKFFGSPKFVGPVPVAEMAPLQARACPVLAAGARRPGTSSHLYALQCVACG